MARPPVTRLVREAGRRLAESGPLLAVRRWRYERQFLHWPGAFKGVYQSFAEAAQSAPSASRLGYDHSEMAGLYSERLDRVYISDYPMMFWLRELLTPGAYVFDFGGHVGIAYHAYARYLRYPDGLQWRVYDMPAVLERGRAIAAEKGVKGLDFTSQVEQASGADVFFASGALQYEEKPLWELLRRLERKPRHLLLNKVPLYDGPDYVTLQHTSHAFNPYQVYNRAAFIERVSSAGYELADQWDDLERSCKPPFHRDRWVEAYTGLYFRAAGQA